MSYSHGREHSYTLFLKCYFEMEFKQKLLFFQVAKTLFNDECLKACPRCQHPARCQSVKGEGVCSHPDCGFQFCTSCLCAFHGARECGSQIVGSRKKDTLLPGSAQSKRNVRRLWVTRSRTARRSHHSWICSHYMRLLTCHCVFVNVFLLYFSTVFLLVYIYDTWLWCTVTATLFIILH